MIKRYKFKEYLSELNEELSKILLSNKRVILKAPTGAGKTKAILEIFKELSQINKNHAYILATPNRSQSEQNSKYDVVVVVGGVKVYELTTDELLATSCVYDKIDTLVNECQNRKLDITLVVDEAHELIYSYSYRKSSIKKIVANLDVCKTVVYMTATADVLINNRDIFKYDYIVECEPKHRKPNAKELNIIQYQKSDLESLTLNTIRSNMDCKHILVRCNDISLIASLTSKLNSDGIHCCYIDSKNKNESDAYGFIVKDGTISDKYKVIFVTSLMDSGVSLMNDKSVLCLYVSRPSEFNLNSIEQFSNRCRNQYGKFILFINKHITCNQVPLEKREQITIDFCKDTLSNLIKNDYPMPEAVDSVLALLQKAFENPSRRFIPYISIDRITGEITIDEYLKAAFVENQAFLKALNFMTPLVLKYNGSNVRIDDLDNDFIEDVFSRFRRIADKTTIKNIKDLKADKELKETIKAAKKEIKENKDEQYMHLLIKLREVVNWFDKFGTSSQNSYAKKILEWLDNPESLPGIKRLNLYSKQLDEIWNEIDGAVSNAVRDDVVSKIKSMFGLCVNQEFLVLKKVVHVKKKSDLTSLLRQIHMINFNVNYNLANKDYIKKYSIEFYDLFLIRNRLDKMVEKKARLSDKMIEKLSSELSMQDSKTEPKPYGIKKLKNTIKLLYNISDNRFTSIKTKLK